MCPFFIISSIDLQEVFLTFSEEAQLTEKKSVYYIGPVQQSGGDEAEGVGGKSGDFTDQGVEGNQASGQRSYPPGHQGNLLSCPQD